MLVYQRATKGHLGMISPSSPTNIYSKVNWGHFKFTHLYGTFLHPKDITMGDFIHHVPWKKHMIWSIYGAYTFWFFMPQYLNRSQLYSNRF